MEQNASSADLKKIKQRKIIPTILLVLWFLLGGLYYTTFHQYSEQISFLFKKFLSTLFFFFVERIQSVLIFLQFNYLFVISFFIFFSFLFGYFIYNNQAVMVLQSNQLKLKKNYYQYLVFSVAKNTFHSYKNSALNGSVLKFLLDLGLIIHFYFSSNPEENDFLIFLYPFYKNKNKSFTNHRFIEDISNQLYPNFLLVNPIKSKEIIKDLLNKNGRLILPINHDLNFFFSLMYRSNKFTVISMSKKNGAYFSNIMVSEKIDKKMYEKISRKMKFSRILVNLNKDYECVASIPNNNELRIPSRNDSLIKNVTKLENEIIIGFNPFTYNPVKLPLSALNVNIQIIGSVGKGKTTLTQYLINQLLSKDIRVFVFDPRGEYRDKFSNSTIYLLGDINGVKINLGDLITDDDDFFVELLEEVLTYSGNEFTPSMILLLKKALIELKELESPNLRDFVRIIKKGRQKAEMEKNNAVIQSYDGLINRLSTIFSNPVFHLFNTSITNLNLEKKGVHIFDFSNFLTQGKTIKEFYLVSSLLLKLIYKQELKKISRNKLKSVIVFEESLFTFSKTTNQSVSVGESLLILGRAYGVGIILITQDPTHVSSLLHSNTSTKIIFQLGLSTSQLSSYVNLPNYLLSKVPSLSPGHYIITSPFLSRDEEAIITNNLLEKFLSNFKITSKDYGKNKDNHITSDLLLPYYSYEDFKRDLISL